VRPRLGAAVAARVKGRVMDRDERLKRIKSALKDAFGPRFHSVILYGSEARGQAAPDSDIDVMVLLTSQQSYWDDVRTAIDATYPLVLDNDGRPISVKPIPVDEYEAQEWPLYQAVKEEGIPI
jgi:predicted nucleotidyltransferase